MNTKDDVWPGDPTNDKEYWDALGRAARKAYSIKMNESCAPDCRSNPLVWDTLPQFLKDCWIETAKAVKAL